MWVLLSLGSPAQMVHEAALPLHGAAQLDSTRPDSAQLVFFGFSSGKSCGYWLVPGAFAVSRWAEVILKGDEKTMPLIGQRIVTRLVCHHRMSELWFRLSRTLLFSCCLQSLLKQNVFPNHHILRIKNLILSMSSIAPVCAALKITLWQFPTASLWRPITLRGYYLQWKMKSKKVPGPKSEQSSRLESHHVVEKRLRVTCLVSSAESQLWTSSSTTTQ